MAKKCQCCWFSIILSVALIISGIDNWIHFFPGVQLSNNVTAVIVIIVGIIGLFLALTCKCCLTKLPEVKPTPPSS